MQRNKSKAWNNADRLYYQFGEYLLWADFAEHIPETECLVTRSSNNRLTIGWHGLSVDEQYNWSRSSQRYIQLKSLCSVQNLKMSKNWLLIDCLVIILQTFPFKP